MNVNAFVKQWQDCPRTETSSTCVVLMEQTISMQAYRYVLSAEARKRQAEADLQFCFFRLQLAAQVPACYGSHDP